MKGFLLINKPVGPTSHDIVDQVRRLTSEKRVGHAGTLDPFASGLLIVGVGREATREFPKLVGLPKTYEATFVLGIGSTTDDLTGELTSSPLPSAFDRATIETAINEFRGSIEQMPPNYSAVKVKGVKAYEAARSGKTLELKSRTVTISRFDLLQDTVKHADGTLELTVRIDCSSGTYIRSLARDLGQKLGTLGHVKTLHRVAVGPFTDAESVSLEQLDPKNVQNHLQEISLILARLPPR